MTNILKSVDELAVIFYHQDSKTFHINKYIQKLLKLDESIFSFDDLINLMFHNEKSQIESLLEYHISIVLDLNGNTYQYTAFPTEKGVIIFGKDISKEKKAKEELIETKNQLNFILEKNKMGTFSLNTNNFKFNCDNNWRRINQVFLYGKFDDLDSIKESTVCDDKKENILYSKILKFKDSAKKESEKFRYKREETWVRCKLYKDFDIDNNIEYITGLCTDITLQVKNENKLLEEKKIAEIQAKNKANFLANMSHEIRTPLNGIIGMTDLLKEKYTEEKFSKDINTIYSCGQSLLQIINDILDFSKIDSGKMTLDLVDFSIKQTTEDIYNIFYPLCDKKNIKLIYDYADSIPEHLHGDDSRLKQILINLVGNALKFTSEGFIKMSFNYKNDYLEFYVQDTGIGIDESQQINIFKAFNQEDASVSRNYGGTGLGLNISKNLVELMNGTISLESKKNQGSTFKVKLPIKESINQNSSQIKKQVINLDGLNVLLVEDNLTNQEVLSMLFEKYNWTITIANNGQEALDLFNTNSKFDLVFMDIQMPVLDGLSTMSILKERYSKLPPIIALTANALNEEKQKCLEIGFNDFLTKPLITWSNKCTTPTYMA